MRFIGPRKLVSSKAIAGYFRSVEQTRTRRSILSFLSAELSTAVVLSVAFFATPLLLRWLGDERYGAFEAASDWFGYVALLELGIGAALRPLLALAWADRDQIKFATLMASGLRAYAMLGVLMLIAGIALTAMIPRLVPVSGALVKDLRFGCLIGVVGLLMVPFSPFRALFEAEQKSYLINAALLGQSLLITVGSLLLARARWGIAGQFLAVFLGTCAFTVVVSYGGFRQIREVLWGRFRNLRRSSEWKAIWNLNRPSFAFNICSQVSYLTDNIIIGALMSPALIVPFFVTQRLAALTQRELQGIGNASWAALVELHAQRQTESFNRRLIELTRLVAILGASGLVPIIAYNHCFVTFWVGARRYGGDGVTIVAAINAFLLAVFSLWTWCISGTGRVARLMPGLVIQTIINVSGSLILTLKFGLIGPLLGSLAGFLAVSSWYLPLLLHRLFETAIAELMRAALVPLISAVPFGAVLWQLSRTFPPRGWVELAGEMSLAAAAHLAAWWLVGINTIEKELWRRRAYALVFGNFVSSH